MTPDALQSRLLENFPNATVQVVDLTGSSDHFDVTIVSEAFVGKRLLQQHKMVYAVLPELESGEIHALKLTTKKPA